MFLPWKVAEEVMTERSVRVGVGSLGSALALPTPCFQVGCVGVAPPTGRVVGVPLIPVSDGHTGYPHTRSTLIRP